MSVAPRRPGLGCASINGDIGGGFMSAVTGRAFTVAIASMNPMVRDPNPFPVSRGASTMRGFYPDDTYSTTYVGSAEPRLSFCIPQKVGAGCVQ